eukprot:CAMPEP_0198144250 /NCGR_PEP_ID=MMETSP1443-20131203/14333_1 /TAXON_ID=186043 /ORGANISM="Entomoneis sp., Strain CCMP2396" /LENGTH=146 /DNA_ID=CAMNT_0043807609 /DNA_START=41 /DNA_END=481 /DNA_ORIENTATION=+
MIQESAAFLIRTPMRMLSSTNNHAGSIKAGMKELPAAVVKYSQIPKGKVFTKETIPRGLLKEHTTRAGTWGVIQVSKGELEYQINEPTESVHKLDSTTQTRGIIEPQIKHQVAPLSDDVEFVVEFYRLLGTGPVVEKREGLRDEQD